MKQKNNLGLFQNDTLYLFGNELTTEVENITEQENCISTYLLKQFCTSVSNEEIIHISITPKELYNLLISLQRLYKN